MSRIYTNGAFLHPIMISKANEDERWAWLVTEFVDDCYKDGEICASNETASSLQGLLEYNDDD